MRIALLVLIAALVLGGCAHDVRVNYPAPAGAPTGTLVLLFSQPASDVNVAINGVLVVEGQHTGRVTIANVPSGNEEVVITANGADKAFKTWVDSDHPTTIPLGVPDASTGFWKGLAGTLLTVIVYSLLH